jgi:hypothetical protein
VSVDRLRILLTPWEDGYLAGYEGRPVDCGWVTPGPLAEFHRGYEAGRLDAASEMTEKGGSSIPRDESKRPTNDPGAKFQSTEPQKPQKAKGWA